MFSKLHLPFHLIRRSPCRLLSSTKINLDNAPPKQSFASEDLKKKTNEKFKKAQAKVLTIPNILTFSRIAITPATGFFIWNGMYTHALGCFAFAATTDLLDGLVARVLNQQSTLGETLDPIADKFLLTTCFVTMYNTELMPLWLIKGLILRDLIILGGGAAIRYFGFNSKLSLRNYFDFKNYPTIGFEPNLASKCNTALQCLLIVIHLSTHHMVGQSLYDWSLFSLQVTTALTTSLSLGLYVNRFVKTGIRVSPPYARN